MAAIAGVPYWERLKMYTNLTPEHALDVLERARDPHNA